MDAHVWDKEYSSGKWGSLAALADEAHHLVIASYVNGLKPNATILDVGCGEGVLNRAVRRFSYKQYVGIDISAVAIAAAQLFSDPATAFHAVSADNFSTDQRFDAIVFNETLYYFANPVETIRRYAEFLAEDGIFVISMHMFGIREGLLKLGIWRDLEAQLQVADETTIHRAGDTWIVRALAPRSTAPR
jgi:SAM-dependent methyltransferase